jgi:hypothetical protein
VHSTNGWGEGAIYRVSLTSRLNSTTAIGEERGPTYRVSFTLPIKRTYCRFLYTSGKKNIPS